MSQNVAVSTFVDLERRCQLHDAFIRSVPELGVVVYYLHPQVDGTRSVYVYKYVVCVFFDSVGGVVSAKLSNLMI